MLMDRFTEAIAHFIGLFQTSTDELRLRKDFEEFQASRTAEKQLAEIPVVPVDPKAPFLFNGMDPELNYQPVPPDVVWLAPWSHVNFVPPSVQIPDGPVNSPPGHLIEGFGFPAGHFITLTRVMSSGGDRIVELDPPHQIASLAHQANTLLDNDYVSVGTHGLKFSSVLNTDGKMIDLISCADQLTPLKGFDSLNSTSDIAEFITQAPAALRAFAAEHHSDPNVTVIDQAVITETVVNGQVVKEAPKLDDHLPPKDDALKTTAEPVHHVAGQGAFAIEASVEVEAGGNTLANIALLKSHWLSGLVTAVLGDYVEVNAITQANVWSDCDSIGSSLNGWTLNADKVTEAFNIASFKRIDMTDSASPVADDAGFPKGWAVTEIKGDMIFLNWFEQLNFMIDNDIHILSSTGVKTIVTTGENIALNNMSFTELGYHFDLIIIGGSIYDGNFINQKNILLDDDLIGAVSGFSANGSALMSTGGNLLWNQATIINVGGADRFEGLPNHYLEAAANFKNGVWQLSDDVLHDNTFAGIEGLRVLDVGGSILDLKYVDQKNILGDSDQVALAMEKAGDAHPEADWKVETGSNVLVNIATIVDVDSTGTTYVGGDHYSDEILIQAELVSPNDSLGGQNPDVLVNEAVAFLGDDLAGPDGGEPTDVGAPQIDAPHADVMQTMLV